MGSHTSAFHDRPKSQIRSNDYPDVTSRRYVWYYQSNPNPWLSTEKPTWTRYSDIDIERIEENYEKSDKGDLIDLGDYWIDLKKSMQIRKTDRTKERKIKRELVNVMDFTREGRRFLEIPNGSGPFHDIYSKGGYHGFIKAWRSRNENLSDNDLLELAAKGIVYEAPRAGHKLLDAEWVATKLRSMKNLTKGLISIGCIKLYTMESFLYQFVNQILRDNDQSKLDTIGPFCYLLFHTRFDESLQDHLYWGIVYRGIELDAKSIDACRQAIGQWKCWFHFSSTSKICSVAERFGNTVFIIDVRLQRGALLLGELSSYPMEDEVLLPAGSQIRIDSVDYDDEKKKHYIRATVETRDPPTHT